MSPAERPSGWTVTKDGVPYGKSPALYRSLGAADDARLRLANKGIRVHPEPLWSRDAWLREMARRADA